MLKTIKYTVFETKWGYFGLASTEFGVLRTQLPGAETEVVKSGLLENLLNPHYDKEVFRTVQEKIIAYYNGAYVNFNKSIPVITEGLSEFAKDVLNACRDIRYGQRISYGQLAKRTGSRSAARAVGGCLSRNRLPLIIPCHRLMFS